MTFTDEGLRLIDEAVGAGLALQTEVPAALLDADRSGELDALLRGLFVGASSPGTGASGT
ncbi:hypothetical protein [Streptomyces tricolor]|uniref:hypothetical protein n=1 Tax=Streptomyces tricolor TaxID=68277 RepID=UPI003D70C130